MKPFPAFVALALLLFNGCASISVRNVEKRAAIVQRPAVIYVADYETQGGDWKITSRSRSDEQYREEVTLFLSSQLAADLQAYLKVPVRRVGKSHTVPPDGWLITGSITRLHEGNPAGRITVGLGLGATKLETNTIVFDGRFRDAFLRFATTGGSNAYPGALVSGEPTVAVFSGVSQAMRGIEDDVERTSRMITASVLEYEIKERWMTPSSLKVKRPGQFQIFQPQRRPRSELAQ